MFSREVVDLGNIKFQLLLRLDQAKFNIPILVIHGNSDATVPFEYSGKLTPEAIPNSKVALIKSGLHGFNATQLSFLMD